SPTRTPTRVSCRRRPRRLPPRGRHQGRRLPRRRQRRRRPPRHRRAVPRRDRRMKAVVLVGGEGTRLRPLTLTTPKPLLPIVNQAFLERQLCWLASHGVDDVVLSLGYRADAFEKHFPDGRFESIRLHYKVEDEPLGTAGAIRYAAEGIDE